MAQPRARELHSLRAEAAGAAGNGGHQLTRRIRCVSRCWGARTSEAIVDGGFVAMRHIIGFLLALAVSAALFFGAGWGFSKFSVLVSGQGLRTATAWTSLHNVLPIAALIGTALLLGILLAVRSVSALATGLPGLALIGWSALLLLRGAHALTYIPM